MEKADQFSESELQKGQSVPGLVPTNVPNDTADLWICEVCGREFNSKKSLGNHMRVHTHLQKSSKKPEPTLQIEEPRSCGVCDMQFASQRSLSGHMRRHSNKAIKSDSEREADEQDAVYALMMLATGDEEGEEGSLRKRKREELEDNGLYEIAETRGHVFKRTKFESGQALGGHQIYHWKGSYGSSSSSAAVDGGEGSGGGRSSDEGKTVVFDFDLNELPPEEENGDGDQPEI